MFRVCLQGRQVPDSLYHWRALLLQHADEANHPQRNGQRSRKVSLAELLFQSRFHLQTSKQYRQAVSILDISQIFSGVKFVL